MGWTSEEYRRRQSDNACFYCGDTGHWANDCPRKSSRTQESRRPWAKKASANDGIDHAAEAELQYTSPCPPMPWLQKQDTNGAPWSWSRLMWKPPTHSNNCDAGDTAQPETSRWASSLRPAPVGNTSGAGYLKGWSHYNSAQLLTFCVLTNAILYASVRGYKAYLRRIPTVDHIKPGFFRQRSLYGYVSRVGDGDNFRLYHTPGGRLAGWGWLPGRRVQDFTTAQLLRQTLHVRIAGVDAPECAHFGLPAQPYSQEALDWLKRYLLGRYVRVQLYTRDRFDRVICSVSSRRGFMLTSDVGLEMLRKGCATVYEAKTGSEFGGMEEQYRAEEMSARERGVGMWKPLSGGKRVETPREYKTRMAAQEQAAGEAKK